MNLPSVGEPIWRPWMVYLLPSQADTRPVHAECDKVQADATYSSPLMIPMESEVGIAVRFQHGPHMDPKWTSIGPQTDPEWTH